MYRLGPHFPFQPLTKISKRNLYVSPAPWDHNYCRISSKLHERGGKLAFKILKRTFRAETPSTSISENFSDLEENQKWISLLLHGTLHGNQIHKVRKRIQCSKSGPISASMLPHLFQ